MFLIDLKDAYFQIPIHPESGPFLQFCLKGRAYQFRALCFGLSMASQVFTRVFALVSEWAHRSGMCLLCYLNDWLVIAESRDLLLQHWEASSPVMQGSGDHCQLGEVRPPAVHSCPVSGDADRHVSRDGVPVTGSSSLLLGSGDFLHSASVAPAHM